jgi:hypothetical protein
MDALQALMLKRTKGNLAPASFWTLEKSLPTEP